MFSSSDDAFKINRFVGFFRVKAADIGFMGAEMNIDSKCLGTVAAQREKLLVCLIFNQQFDEFRLHFIDLGMRQGCDDASCTNHWLPALTLKK